MAVPFGTTSDAVAPSSSLGLVAFGVVAVDLWGVVTLCSCLAVVAAYWGACTVSKVLRRRCQMPAVAAGQYRLAATRGQVARLEAIARAVPRGFDVDAPLGGFTALHAACVGGHAGECGARLAGRPAQRCLAEAPSAALRTCRRLSSTNA
jgi:hypothetical protein